MSSRELVVLGTASQAPTRHRNHNGYLLRWDGEGILFDPGEGTQRQMLFAGVTASQINRICVTHFHGDHCLGLPGVLQRMSLDQVPHVVDVHYPGANRDLLDRLRYASIYRDRVRIRERPAGQDAAAGRDNPADGPPAVMVLADMASFRLEAMALDHQVPAVGYRLAEPDGRRMLPARLAAAGIAGPAVGTLIRDGAVRAGGRLVTAEEMSEARPGQRFAFVMDTRLCDAAFALADRADLLVIEATFADADQALAREYGHLTAGQVGRIAAEAGVRRLVLTHFSQRYGPDGGSRLAAEAGAVFGGEVLAASDLDTISVPARAVAVGGAG